MTALAAPSGNSRATAASSTDRVIRLSTAAAVLAVAGIAAVVAAWPAISLVGSYELLVWLIRTPGAVERESPAEHRGEDTACRAMAPSALVIDSGQHSRNDRDLSAQDWQPTGQPAWQPTTPASMQHSDEVPGTGADNCAAVAAYRLSVEAGNPLSERKLAQMFGRTSRRWARARDRRCAASALKGQPTSASATGLRPTPLFRARSMAGSVLREISRT
jgi:hypothetical protein